MPLVLVGVMPAADNQSISCVFFGGHRDSAPVLEQSEVIIKTQLDSATHTGTYTHIHMHVSACMHVCRHLQQWHPLLNATRHRVWHRNKFNIGMGLPWENPNW